MLSNLVLGANIFADYACH